MRFLLSLTGVSLTLYLYKERSLRAYRSQKQKSVSEIAHARPHFRGSLADHRAFFRSSWQARWQVHGARALGLTEAPEAVQQVRSSPLLPPLGFIFKSTPSFSPSHAPRWSSTSQHAVPTAAVCNLLFQPLSPLLPPATTTTTETAAPALLPVVPAEAHTHRGAPCSLPTAHPSNRPNPR